MKRSKRKGNEETLYKKTCDVYYSMSGNEHKNTAKAEAQAE